MRHISSIRLISIHIHQIGCKSHTRFLTFGNDHIKRSHLIGIIGRINKQYGIAFYINNACVKSLMVMTEEDGIEAWYILGYGASCILCIRIGNNATLITRVEEPYDKVGSLMFVQIGHPSASRLFHIGKFKSFPQRTWQPVRDSGCGKSQESYFHPITFNNRIWRNERMICTIQ